MHTRLQFDLARGMQLDAAALDAHIGARRRGQHFLRRGHIDGALRRYQGHRLFRGQTHARLLALQAQLAAGGVQTDALFLDRAAIAAQSLGEEHHALRHADGQVRARGPVHVGRDLAQGGAGYRESVVRRVLADAFGCTHLDVRLRIGRHRDGFLRLGALDHLAHRVQLIQRARLVAIARQRGFLADGRGG
ncbi:hypothetical protein G6F57_018619 [Rhizopus arrhizus]|nr:hypothetical protein G6F57_018619 [Rhizopus arrhizus]